MKRTQNQFDNALVIILGANLVNAIGPGNRTRLLSIAIEKVFLDEYEFREEYAGYRPAIAIIRETALSLREHGQFNFKK